LDEVIVTATKDNSLFGTKPGRIRANECGDYVCIYHILNCANHQYGTAPLKGEQYMIRSGEALTKIIYTGCTDTGGENPLAVMLKGIKPLKEFYVSDSVDMKASEPLLRSTLFWKHFVALKGTDPVRLSFFTGDITGRFVIIVQGLSDEDVVAGETSFSVKN